MGVALKPVVGPLVLVAMLVVGSVVPAMAQRTSPDGRLRTKIERMEQDLRDLERYVYNRPQPAAPQSEDAGILGAAADSPGSTNLPATAILSERVDNLDEAVRTLTGQVEELNFRVRQLSQQLERVMADFDYRLRALEGNAGPRPSGPYSSTLGGVGGGAGPGATRNLSVTAAPAGAGGVDVGFPTAPPGEAALVGSDMAGAGAPRSLGSVSASRLSGSEETDFEIGMQLLRQGDFDGAQTTFQDFVAGYPESDKLGEAHFWLGESLYVRGLYADAATAYLTSARDHADGDKAADSLLKLGMSLAALGQTDQACSAFDQVARSYPDASDRVTRNVARERAANSCN